MPTNDTARLLRAAGTALPAIGAALLLVGCATPLHDRPVDELRRAVAQSAGREMIEAQKTPDIITLTREPRVESLGLRPDILEELETMAGPASYAAYEAPLGDSLLPGPQRIVQITLERAVRSAVSNNLNIQFARLTPAISQSRLVSAQAAFDWVLFADSQWQSIDQPRVGSTFAVQSDQRQSVASNAGVRRQLTTGGVFSVATGFTYSNVATSGLQNRPNPAYDNNIILQLDQPLLRNFGSDASLAQVRLARNAERDDIQELKAELIRTVTQVDEAYWNLASAQADLKIVMRLLESGEDVRRTLEGRIFEVTPAQLSDARASVETRRSNVLRAQNAVRRASTTLKQLINDPELPVGSELLVFASDAAIDAPVQFSLADAFALAMANRPEVQRSLLSIDDTATRLRLADNQRLPQLNLRAQTRFSGLASDPGAAYESLFDDNFVDFLISLQFEMPIGNRAAEAQVNERRIEQMQSVVAYRNTLQNIALEVKLALYDLVTNYALIEQTRAARVAAAENVRTLLVQEEFTAGQTAEFLDLKLRRQEALAAAEQDEIGALTQYNTSLARLYAAMGTALQRNQIQFTVPDVPQLDPVNPLFPIVP
jgi:outer membrane protein